MKTLYFDCFAGASGNMILGALLSLGVELSDLENGLRGLAVTPFELKVNKVDRAGIASMHVEVLIQEETKHRHLRNIEKIIDDSDLSGTVKDRSKAIFRRLADAEARVHGIEVEKVHFHEVGAVDAIVDVVGSCIGFEILGIERFVASRLNTGSGFVKMEHGTYPVPPPAVCGLVAGVPIYSNGIEGELLTPTGAAIISTLCEGYGPLPEIIVEQSGYGAGTREYEKFPNVLRLVIGQGLEYANGPDAAGAIGEELVLLETNIDDVSPQVTAYAAERALELGALDSWLTPIQMKKGRPAVILSVLCSEEDRPRMLELFYTETTTLGVRVSRVERNSLPRIIETVETKFGTIRIKAAEFGDRRVNIMPEYDDVRSAAIENRVPFGSVHAEALASYKTAAMTAGK